MSLDIRDHGGSYSGSMNINGIEKQCEVAPGNSVRKGDFVSLFSERMRKASTLVSNDITIGSHLDIANLDDERVFVMYSDGSLKIFGVVVKITDNIVEVGTPTQLSANPLYSSGKISAFRFNDNQVVALFNTSSSSIIGVSCTINNLSISVGTNTQVYNNSAFNITIEEVSVGKYFLVLYNSGTIVGFVLSFNGSSFETGSPIQLSIYSNAGNASISISKLALNDYLILYNQSSNATTMTRICSISGLSITTSAEYTINGLSQSGRRIRSANISDGCVLIAHTDGGGFTYCYLVKRDSPTTVKVVGNTLEVNSLSDSGILLNVFSTLPNCGIVTYSDNSQDTLVSTEVIYDSQNSKLNIKTNSTQLSNIRGSKFVYQLKKFARGDLLVFNRVEGSKLYFSRYHYTDDWVVKSQKNSTVLGLVKDSGTSGENVRAVVPN